VLLAMLVSQVVGLLGTVMLVALSGEAFPSTESVVWAAAAGSLGIVGLAAFYYALGRGSMGIVAPMAALIGAGVPVIVSIAGGASVPTIRLAGMALAMAAVVLISLPSAPRDSTERRSVRIDLGELPFVVLAGLGFAGFFLFADRATADGATWWPIAIVRVAGLSLVLGGFVFALLRSRPKTGSRISDVLGFERLRQRSFARTPLVVLLVATGLGDLGGNVFFVLSKQIDTLAVAVVLSSLYPVVTTVLAVLFLHERLNRLQMLGVVVATVSVPLLR
jgi:drug/metabolite transporter (DMT)-like permease